MKNGIILFMLILLGACSKEESATRSDTYKDIKYRVDTQVDSLLINFPRAVYDNVQKGNIKRDSILPLAGTYLIPATVLANEEISLYGESYKGGDFSLQIIGPGNQVIAQTVLITFDTANALHPSRWYARIKATP